MLPSSAYFPSRSILTHRLCRPLLPNPSFTPCCSVCRPQQQQRTHAAGQLQRHPAQRLHAAAGHPGLRRGVAREREGGRGGEVVAWLTLFRQPLVFISLLLSSSWSLSLFLSSSSSSFLLLLLLLSLSLVLCRRSGWRWSTWRAARWAARTTSASRGPPALVREGGRERV